MNENHSNSYTNGFTQPPKTHNGLWALVMCILIVLVGVISLIGTMTDISVTTEDIHLVRFSREQPQAPENTSRDELSPIPGHEDWAPDAQKMGFSGEWLSPFDQIFRQVPPGLYITDAPDGSQVETGDILLSIDQCRVTNAQELEKALAPLCSGNTVILTVYRDGIAHTIQITLTEAP